MNRGFYTAVSGLMSSVRRMEVAINDLANVQTPGYKAERSASTSFSEQLVAQLDGAQAPLPVGPMMLVNMAEAPQLDMRQGPLSSTGRPLDIALDGTGFLVVDTSNGVAYTRDGSMSMDDGYLTTTRGARVLGESGPIRPSTASGGGTLSISPDGTVIVDGSPVDRLKIVEFAPDQRFTKLGENLVLPADASQAPSENSSTTVHQGFVEGSNVDVTTTMTSMLELQRAYSANSRMIQFHDQMLTRAVNDIARPTS